MESRLPAARSFESPFYIFQKICRDTRGHLETPGEATKDKKEPVKTKKVSFKPIGRPYFDSQEIFTE